MKPFLNEDFFLESKTARHLYHQMAETLPIVDYHCHLIPREIAENRVFYNLTQMWLEGDHYKWRLMRANGTEERYITGNADDYEKFERWAATLERAIGNPLYLWSHLELQRYFGYHGRLCAANAKEVWDHCNRIIGDGMPVGDILRTSRVTLLCTTDDPVDSLEWHERLATSPERHPIVLPTFRPDKAVNIEQSGFGEYIGELSEAAGIIINDLDDLTAALDKRLDYFAEHDCCIADHGLNNLHYRSAEPWMVNAIFQKRLDGGVLSEVEVWQYKTAVLSHLGRGYAKRGWAMQLHFAALRGNNTRMVEALGPDTGYDAIGPAVDIKGLACFLDELEQVAALPKTILYSLDPADNALLVALMACFQGSGVGGKLQHGSAWWFNDHKAGMETQLTTLANGGLLGNFIGMLTDSRSFLSYTRHEYFRRILCNLIGTWVDNGEFPGDKDALNTLVADISYHNSIRYFGWQHFHLEGAEQL